MRVGAGAYRTPLEVLHRPVLPSGTGAPVDAWVVVGRLWGAVVGAGAAEQPGGAGTKATQTLQVRVRWFQAWADSLAPANRIRLDGRSYDLRGAVEEPGDGADRSIALALQAVVS